MAKKSKKGLASANAPTKKRVSEAGHAAQGDQTSSDLGTAQLEWEEEEYMVIPDQNLNEDLGSEEMEEDENSNKRGMGSPNYPADVAAEARRKGGED